MSARRDPDLEALDDIRREVVARQGLLDFAGCADGRTYEHARDHARLSKQRAAVWSAMSDQAWHTLAELHARTGEPEASISARLRDFRKAKFGGHEVERRYLDNGLWQYRIRTTQGGNHGGD